MSGHQHGWATQRTVPLQRVHDRETGVGLVSGFDFVGSKRRRHRNGAVEIVGVRGAEARNLTAGLRPRGGVTGMSVRDAANGWERPIQRQVRFKIRRGP